MPRSPLQEIPLSRVPLPLTPMTASRPNKRPFLQEGHGLSPTKRRILSEEGLLPTEKGLKSPFRIRDTATSPSLTEGQPSPAKKLDFSEAKNASSSTGVKKPTSAAPSPLSSVLRTPIATPNSRSNGTPIDDFFATPERLQPSTSAVSTRLVPRPLPACSEPHSDHYPGFRIHRDPHIVISEPLDIEMYEVRNAKENFAPKRMTKKANAEDDNKVLMTPGTKRRELEKSLKVQQTPATPKKTAPKDRSEPSSPTPRRPAITLGGRPWVATPLSADAKRERRRLMIDEVEAGRDEGAFMDF